MARKGRPVTGWLVIDKPAGIGSTDIVNKLRWLLKAKKAGHAGTLDPDATGVLAVAFGEATKTVALLTDSLKAYRFEIAFGAETSTDDAAGQVTATSDLRPTDAEIAAALPAFRGEILQVPPRVSAVKVEGERAYDLAREGEDFTLAARPLWVESLEVVERPSPDRLVLEMVCGKGGYVRAIARDLGRAVGSAAHVVWLRRLWSGPFDVADALPWETALSLTPEALKAALLPIQSALTDLPEVRATIDGARRIRLGNPGDILNGAEGLCWASHAGEALGIGEVRHGLFHPSRVFVPGGEG